jgi:hypothetical protein
MRNEHCHPIDIMEPRVDDPCVEKGTIWKLFVSTAGRTTIYEFDSALTHCYYYAHLDSIIMPPTNMKE